MRLFYIRGDFKFYTLLFEAVVFIIKIRIANKVISLVLVVVIDSRPQVWFALAYMKLILIFY